MKIFTLRGIFPRRGWRALAAVIMLIAALAGPSPAQGQDPIIPRLWLPLVSRANPNPLHSGVATYYDATGDGNCSFGPSPSDLMVAAMNDVEYGNADYCGAYVQVTGRKGSVVVRIVDRCPECLAGHLDLSPQAFEQIDDLPLGRVPITWQVISPDLSGPLAYHFHQDSNPWWTAVQVRNHRNPIGMLEYRNASGQWVEMARQQWNYFTRSGGEARGPGTVRVTDGYGNVLTDRGIPFSPGSTGSGSGQFPYGP